MLLEDPADVPSPCISLCRMDPALGDAAARRAGGLCEGCLRTLDEIIEWGEATPARKRVIVEALEGRRPTGDAVRPNGPL